jgi:raffinose synthase
VDALFSDMHAYLADAGVSGVKVDCQAGVGLVGSSIGGGPAAAATAHRALEDSIAAHFADNHAINCMCHSTENIYRWRDTAVARASDDFYPTDRASHIPHLAACAFNGLFLSPLALPDWDMFSSRHVAADIHAAARAVSGGPVYVSDAPGSHSFDLLRRLVLPDGTVLRAALPGRPTRDSLLRDVMRDGTSLLKVGAGAGPCAARELQHRDCGAHAGHRTGRHPQGGFASVPLRGQRLKRLQLCASCRRATGLAPPPPHPPPPLCRCGT